MKELVQRLLGRSDIYFAGSLYMRRWRLIHARRFGIRVHQIMRSDADRELHDHPFTFVSLILRGGYAEFRDDGFCTWYGPGSILFRRAETLHRLELPPGRTTWTLVFRGPIRRTWGFQTEAGWVDWREFTNRSEGRGRQAGPYAAESSI